MIRVGAIEITRKRAFLLAATAIGLVLIAGWMVKDYRLPREAQSAALNRCRSWEHQRRLDGRGVPQVWVAPGCFEMGSDPIEDWRARANETPRHTVCISAGFWMDEHEVTNQSFREFTARGGYENRQYWSEEGWRAHEGWREPYPMLTAYDKGWQPRVKITWYEAEAYAAWRGGKLPTEAQWEWAARGPESRRYPWGEVFRDGMSNMDRLDLRVTMAVGSFPNGRSWCGAEDMAGNVWEWTADGYEADAYWHAARVDPFTPPSGPLRVIRGGAWGGTPGGSVGDLRCARRTSWPAANRKLSHGVRIIHAGL